MNRMRIFHQFINGIVNAAIQCIYPDQKKVHSIYLKAIVLMSTHQLIVLKHEHESVIDRRLSFLTRKTGHIFSMTLIGSVHEHAFKNS